MTKKVNVPWTTRTYNNAWPAASRLIKSLVLRLMRGFQTLLRGSSSTFLFKCWILFNLNNYYYVFFFELQSHVCWVWKWTAGRIGRIVAAIDDRAVQNESTKWLCPVRIVVGKFKTQCGVVSKWTVFAVFVVRTARSDTDRPLPASFLVL